MNRIDYEKLILSKSDSIIIDTSAIMDYEGLQRLVSEIEMPLMEMKKKILVPKVVWMELNRHISSRNIDKQRKACHALDIICMHSNIFLIEDSNIDQDEMMKAFADAELLSRLTRNISKCGQLLITNDKKLSKDAFDLNYLESCMGYKINVCYIAHNGFLNECECTKKQEEAQVVKEVKKIVYVKEPRKEDEAEKWFSKVGISVATLVAGITIGKYSDQIVKFIKAVA